VLSTLTAASIAAHAGGPWSGGFGWFFLLIPLFWIAFFALVFAVVRRSRRAAWGNDYGPAFGPGFGPRWAQPGRAAESTLAERFAQGDIDEQEYRARLEVLRANSDYGDPTRK
jgi:putative membrane protein